jgi:hypothetical protein
MRVGGEFITAGALKSPWVASPDPSDVPCSFLAPEGRNGMPTFGLHGMPPNELAVSSLLNCAKEKSAVWTACLICQTPVHATQNFCMYCGSPQTQRSAEPASVLQKSMLQAPGSSPATMRKARGRETGAPGLQQGNGLGGLDSIKWLQNMQKEIALASAVPNKVVLDESFYHDLIGDDDGDDTDAFNHLVGSGDFDDDQDIDCIDHLPREPSSCKIPPTTLMIRNIPVMYTQEALVLEWPNNGLYDFFYLPWSCSQQRNLTYAFINFTSHQAALNFKSRWQKQRLAQFTARKPLNISCADVQGRDANLWQLQKKRIWRLKVKECQPLIFENGVQISLSEAFRRMTMKTGIPSGVLHI